MRCKPASWGVLLAPELLKKRFPQRTTLAATGIIVRAHGGLHHDKLSLRVDDNRLTVNAHQCKDPSRTGWQPNLIAVPKVGSSFAWQKVRPVRR